MKNKLIYLFICLFMTILTCRASLYENKTTAKDLTGVLPEFNNIECKFKQEKILKNIDKPLVSGGNFRFDKKQGIFFETTYPVRITTSYTNKDCEQINDIILAISNKKYAKLDNTFDFYYKKTGNTWVLGLKPKVKSGLDKYIDSITIEGIDYINKIVISLKDGSKTTQWFSIE